MDSSGNHSYRRFWKIYLSFGICSILGGMYLVNRLMQASLAGNSFAVFHYLAPAAAFLSFALILHILRNIRPGDRRLRIFRTGIFWRYWLYALLVSLILVAGCVPPQEKRHVFRALLIAFFCLHLVPLLRESFAVKCRKWMAEGWLRGADIALFNLSMAILLLELGLRGFGLVAGGPLFSPPNIKAAKRIRDYRLPPGGLHMGFPANGDGFYDREFQPEKPPGTFRILGLADSFGVESVPYERNFLTLLEGETILPDAETVEVLNLSVDAISPEGYLHLLRKYWPSHEADFALVCLFVGNDITGLPMHPAGTPFLYREFWYLGFIPARILSLARNHHEQGEGEGQGKGRAAAVSGKTDAPDGNDADAAPTFSESAFLRIERQRLDVCSKTPSREVRFGYRRIREILHSMKSLTEGRMLAVFIPDEFQVNDHLWERLYADSDLDPSAFDRFAPQERLRTICDSAGIESLDLLPAFRAEPAKSFYRPRDTHWNADGHALATRVIAQRLRALLADSR
jgi:hypothetical protein